VFSQKGVQVDSAKTKAIELIPAPSSCKLVRSFLGIASFYRRFIQGFSAICRPLHNLTKKDVPFEWTDECQAAFLEIKKRLVSAPILALFDPSKPVEIHTDASEYAIGFVLQQPGKDGRLRAVVYGSRLLNQAEKVYSTCEKECLSAVYAVEQLKEYLYGREAILRTDHLPLKGLINISNPQNSRLVRWIQKLRDSMVKIEYTKGSQNLVPDALSRNVDIPVEQMKAGPYNMQDVDRDEALCFNFEESSMRNQLLDGYMKDPLLASLYARVKAVDTQAEGKFSVQHDVLYYKPDEVKRMVIPRNLIPVILNTYHNSPWAGHMSVQRLKDKIAKRFFWPTLNESIIAFVRSCPSCAQHKAVNHKPVGLTQPTPIYPPLEAYYVDLLGPLPSSGPGKHQFVALAVCSATRYVIADSMRSAKAKSLMNFIVNRIVFTYGTPKLLSMDNASINRSDLVRESMDRLGVALHFTLPYTHTGNSVAERHIQALENVIRHYCERNTKDWSIWLPSALFAMNTSLNRNMEHSPYSLVFGREPVLPADIEFPLDNNPTNDYLVRAQSVRELVRLLLVQSQDKEALIRDRSRITYEYKPGDLCYIDFPNLALLQASRKLSPKAAGPFRVVEKLNNVTYAVQRIVDSGPQPKPIRTHIERMRNYTERPPYLQVQVSPTSEPPTSNPDPAPITPSSRPILSLEPTSRKPTVPQVGAPTQRTRSGRQIRLPVINNKYV